MKRVSMALVFIGLISFILAQSSEAAQITITFDEHPVTTPPPKIGVRYSNNGVLLPKTAQIISLPSRSLKSKAHSGTKVLISDDFSKEHDPEPLIIEFTCDVKAVTVYTGVPWDSHGERVYITLKAFDKNGNLVATAREGLVGPTDINVAMQVKAPQMQYIIRKVELDAREKRTSYFEFIDDLTLTSEGPPPILAKEPPKVYITSPTNKETGTGKITISGNIHGDGLLPKYAPPDLKISFPVAPGSGILPHKQELILNKELHWVFPIPAGPKYLAFSLPFQLSYFGKNTITVTASNAAGTGVGQTSITFLPNDIVQEYKKKGKWNTFGDLIWGGKSGDCSFAIYQKGAIFSSLAGTFSVLGKIFAKWKSLTTPNNPLGLLGCAKGPEKTVPGGISQDFAGGRVYASPKDTCYVIEPFIDAIDKLNFVSEFGLPVTDPVKQYQPLLPILWQKFKRTIDGIPFISTMEVTDKPLTLWVATPDIEGAKRAGAKITSRIPTVWRSFKCNKIDKPCVNVGKPQSNKAQPYSVLEKACIKGDYPFSWGAPAWVSLTPKKEIVPFIGTIKSSGLSSKDAPWDHACSTWLDGAFPAGFAGVDWCTQAVPDPGFEHLLAGQGESISVKRTLHLNYKQPTLEIEYEYCLVGFPPQANPKAYLKPGDKLFVAGRWIADCGCHPFHILPKLACTSPYKSEIHPPAVMIDIYTVQKSGQPATKAEMIYFDWWYPGEVVEIDIYPPPRPKPNATLSGGVSIPLWMNFCKSDGGKCGIQNSFMPSSCPNHIHLKITGRPDVSFHTPPKEDWDGQLHHGHLLPLPGRRGPVDPYYPHTKSLWGDFEVKWVTP